jgi:hypothetical protein
MNMTDQQTRTIAASLLIGFGAIAHNAVDFGAFRSSSKRRLAFMAMALGVLIGLRTAFDEFRARRVVEIEEMDID